MAQMWAYALPQSPQFSTGEAMSKADVSQSVHVKLPGMVFATVKRLAAGERRPISTQVLVLVEEALRLRTKDGSRDDFNNANTAG
jgi:hypothetical protein